jgi:hypothetical protein
MSPRYLEYTLLCSRMLLVYTQQRNMSKLQRGLTAVGSWCQRWNIKINEGKSQVIYFSRRRRMPKDDLQLNGRNISFVNSAKYLGVIFDRRLTWRLHIEKPPAKALSTYIRTYSVFKSKHLSRVQSTNSINHDLCLSHLGVCSGLMKLQRLQNRVLRAIGNLDRRTPVHDLRTKFRTCTIT